MSPHRQLRVLVATAALALWVPATGFFALVLALVARQLTGPTPALSSPIVDLRSALITTGYSIGGAAACLGIAWLALPGSRRRSLARIAMLWIGVTGLLLVARQVSGVPLLIAAAVATVIGVEVNRRLLLAIRDSSRVEPVRPERAAR